MIPFFEPGIREAYARLDVLPFFVPGISEGLGKTVWMCFHTFFLESVKAWPDCTDVLPYFVPANSEGLERMYECVSILCSCNQ